MRGKSAGIKWVARCAKVYIKVVRAVINYSLVSTHLQALV